MNILGLHFGHDAGACVVVNGAVKTCILRERVSRIKHAISLDMRTIELALQGAQISLSQIDCVAITSTQYVDVIIDDPSRFSLEYKAISKNVPGSTLDKSLSEAGQNIDTLIARCFLETFYDESFRETMKYKSYRHYFPEHLRKKRDEIASFGIITEFVYPDMWKKQNTLADLMNLSADDLCLDENLRFGFHYPATVTIDGTVLPACIVAHHAAHAASSFYNSPFHEAAIFTNDGYGVGDKDLSGLFFWGEGSKIYPIVPHHLVIGHLYEMVGSHLGLGDFGAPGKLMGLAPYGRPKHYAPKFLGNYWDWEKRKVGVFDWWAHLVESGLRCGDDISSIGRKNSVTEQFQRDVAASTQKLFEETCLAAVKALARIIGLMGRNTKHLCMSGGSALNCPANERIATESIFDKVFVEPGCDDSGLACGAAFYVYYNLYGHSRGVDPNLPCTPYLGSCYTNDEVAEALAEFANKLTWRDCDCPGSEAAKDLARNLVVAWFQGRSEIGPRALGARSLLADPRDIANWRRVNRIKSREEWRPFAPSVLEEEAHNYFVAQQLPSPYMLFNATVKGDKIPAVTHVDRSSRIQTVNQSNGAYYRLLRKFYDLTGVPVILNTSLNGPSEPIVESPHDAISLFLSQPIEVLYIGFRRVCKAHDMQCRPQ